AYRAAPDAEIERTNKGKVVITTGSQRTARQVDMSRGSPVY
ncbi:MAG: hypothetical protein QOD27_591, partial [Microbacteriaceae bacterium]|nr:hypothetical protein [Microbacteriaceae bacterium]